jgi:hypothetical protein
MRVRPGPPVLLSPVFAGSTAVLGADRPLRRRERGPLDHVNARPDLYEILEERYGVLNHSHQTRLAAIARSVATWKLNLSHVVFAYRG